MQASSRIAFYFALAAVLGRALWPWLLVAAAALVVLVRGTCPSQAMDDGRYSDVDPQTKAWFESVHSPQGVPCCSVADGHRTAWQAKADGTYQVMIDGEWKDVPPPAVILNAHNPTGDSIVWYIKYPDGSVFIRCFVPVDGA